MEQADSSQRGEGGGWMTEGERLAKEYLRNGVVRAGGRGRGSWKEGSKGEKGDICNSVNNGK